MGAKARRRRFAGGPRGLPDHIPPRPKVLFVGINPGVRSAEIGHHFAGYSNRFWRLLHEAGLTPHRLTCEEDVRLPEWGYGITNVIPRPTRSSETLRREEFDAGRRSLVAKIRRYRPGVVALVGVTIYRHLFDGRRRGGDPVLGLRDEALGGAPIFVLPNPSGRNASIPYGGMLEAFRSLRRQIR